MNETAIIDLDDETTAITSSIPIASDEQSFHRPVRRFRSSEIDEEDGGVTGLTYQADNLNVPFNQYCYWTEFQRAPIQRCVISWAPERRKMELCGTKIKWLNATQYCQFLDTQRPIEDQWQCSLLDFGEISTLMLLIVWVWRMRTTSLKEARLAMDRVMMSIPLCLCITHESAFIALIPQKGSADGFKSHLPETMVAQNIYVLDMEER